MSSRARVTVVGSLMIDQFLRMDHLPAPGETIFSDDPEIKFGGKGANQAVAASRVGAQVEMIGCVGNDIHGQAYEERLSGFGLGVSGMRRVDGATGCAFVSLDAAGENSIVVAAGANRQMNVEFVEASSSLIAEADCLLLQNEISHEANIAAANIAREAGIKIVYNPAPWNREIDVGKLRADILIVNEIELAGLLGGSFESSDQLPEGVIVTQGSKETLAHFGGVRYAEKPPTVRPVDTVGAGDTFCGAFALQFAIGAKFGDALRFANRAASLSTLSIGAQEGIPMVDED